MFEWDEHNAEHIARHSVTTDEAEEAMQDRQRSAWPPTKWIPSGVTAF